MGERVTVEVKNTSRWEPSTWLAEAEIERGNDDSVAGLVVAKRRGKGKAGDQIVIMTLAGLVSLLTGERPPEEVASGPA
jgi:hypothetical protein